jgi:HK97 family phage portal protein
VILRTIGGGDLSVRDASLGALIRATDGGLRSSAPGVTSRLVFGLPAWHAAVRLASQSVAEMRHLRVWRGEGTARKPVQSTWQARFFAGVPNDLQEPWYSVLAQTEASLTNSNNAYWLKITDDAGRVSVVYVPDPQAVEVKWSREKRTRLYRVRLSDAAPTDWLDPQHVLHFRRLNLPGCVKDPTPIEIHRDSLAAAVAKVRYEASYYDEGIMQSLAVTMPGEMKPDEADRWREVFQNSHAGSDNAHQVRVFGGGATVATVGLSLRDSQYIESMQMSIEDVARITGVQASLLGGTGSGGGRKDDSAPITPEHEQDRWWRYGLGPRLTQLEEWVKADPSFFGPAARDYPMFDSSSVFRGDLMTEAEIEHMQIQDGSLLADEARAKRGLPPLPNGLGQIPQIVPVGGTPNPTPTPAPET